MRSVDFSKVAGFSLQFMRNLTSAPHMRNMTKYEIVVDGFKNAMFIVTHFEMTTYLSRPILHILLHLLYSKLL